MVCTNNLYGKNGSPETVLRSLKVEYQKRPLGMDVEKPRFSWQMASSKRDQSQSAYQIIVTDRSVNEIWNTGKTSSNSSLHIEYAGEPLQPRSRYDWTLYVWNQNDMLLSATSWFEMGLMNPSIGAWSGAKWIGGDDSDLILYPDYLPTFLINYTLQLDKESSTTKAGFVFGANDPRLMNRNMNIYNLQREKNESYIEAELDISSVNAGGNALLHVYRVGYTPSDNRRNPLQTLEYSPFPD